MGNRRLHTCGGRDAFDAGPVLSEALILRLFPEWAMSRKGLPERGAHPFGRFLGWAMGRRAHARARSTFSAVSCQLSSDSSSGSTDHFNAAWRPARWKPTAQARMAPNNSDESPFICHSSKRTGQYAHAYMPSA